MGFTNDFQKACRSIGKTKLFRGTTTTAVKKQQAHGDDYKKALAIDIFKQRRNGEKNTMIHLQMELVSTGKFYQDIALFMIESLIKEDAFINRAPLFSISTTEDSNSGQSCVRISGVFVLIQSAIDFSSFRLRIRISIALSIFVCFIRDYSLCTAAFSIAKSSFKYKATHVNCI